MAEEATTVENQKEVDMKWYWVVTTQKLGTNKVTLIKSSQTFDTFQEAADIVRSKIECENIPVPEGYTITDVEVLGDV